MLRLVHELTGPSGVGLDTPLMDAGVDSLAAGLLAARLSRAHSAGGGGAPLIPLSHLLIFEAPTPRAIAARMLERATAARHAPPPPPTPSSPPPHSAAVMLVCAAGRFSGGASAARSSLPALWAACGDAVSDAWPRARAYTENTHYTAAGGGVGCGTGDGAVDGGTLGAVSSGGYICGSEGFDAAFFGLSAAEESTYGTQYRVRVACGAVCMHAHAHLLMHMHV